MILRLDGLRHSAGFAGQLTQQTAFILKHTIVQLYSERQHKPNFNFVIYSLVKKKKKENAMLWWGDVHFFSLSFFVCLFFEGGGGGLFCIALFFCVCFTLLRIVFCLLFCFGFVLRFCFFFLGGVSFF